MNEKAVEFVMQFYSIDRETAVQLYMDEIKAAEILLSVLPRNCNERTN